MSEHFTKHSGLLIGGLVTALLNKYPKLNSQSKFKFLENLTKAPDFIKNLTKGQAVQAAAYTMPTLILGATAAYAANKYQEKKEREEAEQLAKFNLEQEVQRINRAKLIKALAIGAGTSATGYAAYRYLQKRK